MCVLTSYSSSAEGAWCWVELGGWAAGASLPRPSKTLENWKTLVFPFFSIFFQYFPIFLWFFQFSNVFEGLGQDGRLSAKTLRNIGKLENQRKFGKYWKTLEKNGKTKVFQFSNVFEGLGKQAPAAQPPSSTPQQAPSALELWEVKTHMWSVTLDHT